MNQPASFVSEQKAAICWRQIHNSLDPFQTDLYIQGDDVLPADHGEPKDLYLSKVKSPSPLSLRMPVSGCVHTELLLFTWRINSQRRNEWFLFRHFSCTSVFSACSIRCVHELHRVSNCASRLFIACKE